MSAVMGLSSDPDRMCKNSITQWRHNSSGEIDVFEAARYFSGGGDIQYPNQNVPPGQRVLACRISLEMPSINNLAAQNDQKQMQEKKKYKQPSSPGGKLASFLNSLFNQTTTASKKTTTTKKKNVLYKSSSSKNDLEEERKRRSSISHFRITTNHDSNANTTTTPTKSTTLRSLSHHQIEVGVSAPSRSNTTNGGGIDQKRIRSGNDINYKNNCGSSLGFSDRSSTMNYYYWGDHEDRQSEFNTRKFHNDNDDHDGADSDSSSDLFDLDFSSSSSGNLPVYGTTHVDRIRIHSAAPISLVSTIP